MTKRQILLLALAFLFGFYLAEPVAAQVQINGPGQTQPGTLAMFEINPPQTADWTITFDLPSQASGLMPVFKTDTSTNRLYFATPRPGMYHVVAAIIVDGKPRIITKVLVNENNDEIKPVPPPPDPPQPDQSLARWIETQLPILVKSINRDREKPLVAECFKEVVQKIENGTIKTAQNARTQLQIALTERLAMGSDTAIDDWHDFLTRLSEKLDKELGNMRNDLHEVQKTFQTVAETLRGFGHPQSQPATCTECQNPNSFQWRFRSAFQRSGGKR